MKRKFNKTVLSLHAHPDDAEAWCAGTLKLLQDKGYEVVIATLTAGGLGGVNSTESETINIRKEEARLASSVLEADYYCLDGRDGFLYDTTELRLACTSLMRKVKAGIVMTHLPVDYHSDHRAACQIVETAAMISSLPNVSVDEKPLEITPLLYHTAPLRLSDPLGSKIADPHFYVDVTSVINTKMEMLSYHKSQIELMRLMHKMDDFFGVIKDANSHYGEIAKVEYAEVFWQHLGGGFQTESQVQEDINEFVIFR